MKLLTLTQGQYAKVDDGDYDSLIPLRWHAGWSDDTQSFYAETSLWIGGRTFHIRLHRILVDCPVGMQVDHRNHDTLDNQKENLRVCTHTQNQHNRRSRGGSSRYKGVSYRSRNGKWQADISVHGRKLYLGTFGTEREAALAYNAAAISHHKEFATLNQMEDSGVRNSD